MLLPGSFNFIALNKISHRQSGGGGVSLDIENMVDTKYYKACPQLIYSQGALMRRYKQWEQIFKITKSPLLLFYIPRQWEMEIEQLQ